MFRYGNSRRTLNVKGLTTIVRLPHSKYKSTSFQVKNKQQKTIADKAFRAFKCVACVSRLTRLFFTTSMRATPLTRTLSSSLSIVFALLACCYE